MLLAETDQLYRDLETLFKILNLISRIDRNGRRNHSWTKQKQCVRALSATRACVLHKQTTSSLIRTHGLTVDKYGPTTRVKKMEDSATFSSMRSTHFVDYRLYLRQTFKDSSPLLPGLRTRHEITN
jgi:hypothetical protein